MAGKIFISYRRDDAKADARHVHDRLSKVFGSKNVFMDVDNLLIGQRFDQELDKALSRCDVFLAVVGPRWLEILNARIASKERDYVREEIAAALKRGAIVIPVLVDEAALPSPDDLPEDVRELVLYQAHAISHTRFGRDVDELVSGIKANRKAQKGGVRSAHSSAGLPWGKLAAAGLVGVVLLGGGAVYSLGFMSGGRLMPTTLYVRETSTADSIAANGERTDAAAEAEAKRKAAEAEAERKRLAMLKEKEEEEQQEKKETANLASDTEWLHPGGNYEQHRFSALNQIDVNNVKTLKIAWSFSTGVLRGHEGAPLVIDDRMYIVTPFPNRVYALDLNKGGSVLWRYSPKQDPSTIPVMCCDTVNRGLAYADGVIYLYQADTNLVALDAKTGKAIWKVANGDPRRGETATNAPIVIKDKVIVGLSGGEFAVRGHVTAYNARLGKKLWRAYSMGPDSDVLIDPDRTTSLGRPLGRDSSLKTWPGDQWKIGGGTAWGWFSYDPDLNLFYYGTGNPSTWNPSQRRGDNKWATSIFARDPDTGLARWVYQMTPFDEWSYDGTNEMILADIDVGGGPRKALVHFDKNGLAYTLDRATGELLVAEKFDPSINWTTGVEMDRSDANYGRPHVVKKYSTAENGEDIITKDICPSSAGAKNQGPAAFSPKTGLFYVPTNHMCMDYEPFGVSYTVGQPYVGATLAIYAAPGSAHRGNFIAWDASRGEIVWQKNEAFPVWSGALTTAGGLAFYGTLDGNFKAVDVKDGREVFSHRVSSGIIGNPITYGFNGKQYVAVLSGVGGWAGIGLAAGLSNPYDGLGMVGATADLGQYTQLGGQLIVFSLP